MKQLSPADANFYNMETIHNPPSIGSLWICDQSDAPDGVIRHKDILKYLETRIHGNSMFRRRLVKAPLGLDWPYWLEDDNFDMEYHVRHVGLPQPGDMRQLCIFTSRITARAMDNDRAPWEIYIIEGLNDVEGVPPGSFAVFIRLHHAYADGKTSIELLGSLLSDTPEDTFKPHQIEYIERAPTSTEMWARTIPNILGQSVKSVRAGVKAAQKGLELYQRLNGSERPDQSSAPTTMFNAKVSPHRVYNSLTWDISDLQAARKLAENASLNDVLISVIGGGMRRYLQKHKALPGDESLVALCPVSVRPKESQKDGGNMVSAMAISMGTDIEDPAERLEAIHSRTQRGIPLAREVIIELGEAVNDIMPPYVHSLQSWITQKLDISGMMGGFNTIITNVPGPAGGEKFFAGARIANVHPVVPITDGMALTHGITGIAGRLTVGVLSDRAVMKDIDFYIECLRESTQEYVDATAKLKEKPVAKKEKPAATKKTTAKATPKKKAVPAKAKAATKKAPAKKAPVKKAPKAKAAAKPAPAKKKAAPKKQATATESKAAPAAPKASDAAQKS